MTTTTELRIQYTYFSWSYDFPPAIETVLENDYVVNRYLYDESALKRVATLLLIDPDTSPQGALDAVRNRQTGCKELSKQEEK